MFKNNFNSYNKHNKSLFVGSKDIKTLKLYIEYYNKDNKDCPSLNGWQSSTQNPNAVFFINLSCIDSSNISMIELIQEIHKELTSYCSLISKLKRSLSINKNKLNTLNTFNFLPKTFIKGSISDINLDSGIFNIDDYYVNGNKIIQCYRKVYSL